MVSGDNPGPCLMHFTPPRYPQGYPCPPSIQTNTTHIHLRQLEPGIRLPIKLGHSRTIMTSIHLPIVPSLKLLNLECFVLVVNEAKGRNSMVAYPATKKDFHIVVLKQLKFHIYIVENEHEWLWLLKSVPLFRNLLSLLMSINKEKEKETKTNHNILYVHAILSKTFP